MRLEGNLEVLSNLLRKKQLMEQGDENHSHYRPIVFASTGVMRGALSGGKAIALERRGLHRVFTHVLGSSTGAAGGQFFVAGEVHKHNNLHWVEGADEHFISFKRFFAGGGPIEDTGFICEAFRRKLDLTKFRANPAEFWVGVTSARTGKGEFLNGKRADMHPTDLVRASIAIPGLCGGPVYVDGHPYYDGAGAMGMPTREIIEQFSPTDLLIFPNCPNEEKGGAISTLLSTFLLARESPSLKRVFLTRHKRFAEGLNYLRTQARCRWLLIWCEEGIGQFERNSKVLESAAHRAEVYMESLLVQAETRIKASQKQLLATG